MNASRCAVVADKNSEKKTGPRETKTSVKQDAFNNNCIAQLRSLYEDNTSVASCNTNIQHRYVHGCNPILRDDYWSCTTVHPRRRKIFSSKDWITEYGYRLLQGEKRPQATYFHGFRAAKKRGFRVVLQNANSNTFFLNRFLRLSEFCVVLTTTQFAMSHNYL